MGEDPVQNTEEAQALVEALTRSPDEAVGEVLSEEGVSGGAGEWALAREPYPQQRDPVLVPAGVLMCAALTALLTGLAGSSLIPLYVSILLGVATSTLLVVRRSGRESESSAASEL